jgi:hypothetical protein
MGKRQVGASACILHMWIQICFFGGPHPDPEAVLLENKFGWVGNFLKNLVLYAQI